MAGAVNMKARQTSHMRRGQYEATAIWHDSITCVGTTEGHLARAIELGSSRILYESRMAGY